MHSNTTNPVQMVRVDTAKNTLKSWVYAPWTKAGLPEGHGRAEQSPLGSLTTGRAGR